jgi:hypothetical protein
VKLIVLGRGNAGCISAMHFGYFRKFLNTKVEIELIYDSKIKPVPTGQGTTLQFPDWLFKNFFSNYLHSFPTTLKTGIMYENWGKKNKKIFHPFPLGRYAIHFNPEDFQNYVCKNLNIDFTEKDENIKNYNSLDADYIIDCRGTPESLKEYNTLINPLNCALLADLPKKENDVLWTGTTATPDGWCFYIPLPKKTSIGYLFNNKITSVKKAKANFKKLFGVEKINHVFPFNQYVAKEPIIEDRVLLNGNKLFFLEPLEATAMGSYVKVSQFYYNYIILYHYSNGSIYDTNFWKKAGDLWKNTETLMLDKELKITKGMSSEDMERSLNSEKEFGLWPPFSIKQWQDRVA